MEIAVHFPAVDRAGMLGQTMNHGPNLGSEREVSKHPAGGGLGIAPTIA